MAIIYREWRTFPASLLADLQTHMLASGSDWARPNSGARPHTYKTTTTRGAEMVIDFNDAAPGTRNIQCGMYRTYDGTTLGARRPGGYLFWKPTNNGTAAANPIYCTLSHSKDHLFLSIEGPRNGENAAESVYGSPKEYLFMDSLAPYYDTSLDPQPAVVTYLKEYANWGVNNTVDSIRTRTSRSVDGTIEWGSSAIRTLWDGNDAVNRVGLDGKLVLSPYVVYDDKDGFRGRLNSFFYAGPNIPTDMYLNEPPQPNSYVDQGGVRYKILEANRGDFINSRSVAGAFGNNGNDGTAPPGAKLSPLIAVPYGLTP